MAVNLKGRSFLTLKDFSPLEIRYFLNLSKDLKAKKRMGVKGNSLECKNIVLLFDKTSTRTRCAFETAAYDEGANVTYLTNSQFQVKESLEDSAKVLGRYYDGIEYRGYKQDVVEKLAKHSGVPVWNGLTDVDHPTQVLADFLTLEEHLPNKLFSDIKFVFTGDTRNNMAYALMYGGAKLGMHIVALGPKKLSPDSKILQDAQMIAEETGGKIEYTDDVKYAVKDADVVYTDVWVSMGEDVDYGERAELLEPYRVTMDMLKKTENKNVLFMHCLPAYHDFNTEIAKKMHDKGIDIREVTDDVFRSRHSVVFDEAENRLHTIKAVMVATMG
jgi:ornithine carbamoyltransferase